MRCNVTQEFRQLIPDSPFVSLIAFIAEVYRGRTTAGQTTRLLKNERHVVGPPFAGVTT
ncbi:MAG: hypothetical protein ISR34_12265 [Pirellulales bacterium]|nr:hypothetical protein [Pirellulales bacterium]